MVALLIYLYLSIPSPSGVGDGGMKHLPPPKSLPNPKFDSVLITASLACKPIPHLAPSDLVQGPHSKSLPSS